MGAAAVLAAEGEVAQGGETQLALQRFVLAVRLREGWWWGKRDKRKRR